MPTPSAPVCRGRARRRVRHDDRQLAGSTERGRAHHAARQVGTARGCPRLRRRWPLNPRWCCRLRALWSSESEGRPVTMDPTSPPYPVRRGCLDGGDHSSGEAPQRGSPCPPAKRQCTPRLQCTLCVRCMPCVHIPFPADRALLRQPPSCHQCRSSDPRMNCIDSSMRAATARAREMPGASIR